MVIFFLSRKYAEISLGVKSFCPLSFHHLSKATPNAVRLWLLESVFRTPVLTSIPPKSFIRHSFLKNLPVLTSLSNFL